MTTGGRRKSIPVHRPQANQDDWRAFERLLARSASQGRVASSCAPAVWARPVMVSPGAGRTPSAAVERWARACSCQWVCSPFRASPSPHGRRDRDRRSTCPRRAPASWWPAGQSIHADRLRCASVEDQHGRLACRLATNSRAYWLPRMNARVQLPGAGGGVRRDRIHRAAGVRRAAAAQGALRRRRARPRQADRAVGVAGDGAAGGAGGGARRSRGARGGDRARARRARLRRAVRAHGRAGARGGAGGAPPLSRHHRRERLHAGDRGARRRGAGARRGAGQRGRLRRGADRCGGGAGRRTRRGGTPELLRIAIQFGGRATQGTTRSALEHADKGGLAYIGGQYVPEPVAADRWQAAFPPPLGDRVCVSIPWGDLATAPRSTGARTVRTYMAVSPTVARVMPLVGLASKALSWGPARRLAEHWVSSLPEGPSDAERARARCAIVAEAQNGARTARAWVTGGRRLRLHGGRRGRVRGARRRRRLRQEGRAHADAGVRRARAARGARRARRPLRRRRSV